MAVFNDTTNLDGLINIFEFWTRQQSGALAGNSLKEATVRINAAFEKIMPLLLQFNDQMRWDDTNHTDAPIGTTNIVANQEDYKLTTDDNSLAILNIVKVRILPTSSASQYVELERMTPDDERFATALAPTSSDRGVPSHFVELGNTIYLYPEPNYSASNGLQIFFQREQSYFASTDTEQEPGIPKPFHEILALYAALDWNMVNRTDDGNLISMLRERIKEIEKNLYDFVNARHPSRAKMTPRLTDNGMGGGGSSFRFYG